MSVDDIAWSSWTSAQATGVGTLSYNDCTPTCADGHFHKVANTKITLTDPVPDINGRLVWSRSQENPLPPGWATGPLHGQPQRLVTQPD